MTISLVRRTPHESAGSGPAATNNPTYVEPAA
jgi:hypothetical protein